MADNFWHNAAVEPKRNFRFELTIAEDPNLIWLVKTVEKPKLNVSSVPHKFINHTFNYPGRVVWNPVAITLVDVPLGEPLGADGADTTGRVMTFLRRAGYRIPLGDANVAHNRAATNIEKAEAVGALGTVFIRQLANDTTQEAAYIDEWELKNAYLSGDITFGSLDYANEELTTISFTLQYDWARFKDVTALHGSRT
tara:strand:+ start:373 stop:963 length:591 start_codon:yes stop_codon:yes gene_type:complete